ncbi:uncharacterized protein LOC130124095 [Lampris incognitus]|uniref:uncharacterized protein LOC130124095 n=1 Tax=Lampris incognitus TaxID=2546036 RepID=UPI0024B4C9DC|nr:uncharacterized protein LOC130124095 [Lampris incognitus]
MLLLILCAGCLALSAGQTTSAPLPPSATTGLSSPVTDATHSQLNTALTQLPPDSMHSALAVFHTAVKSDHELNSTTIAVLLDKLVEIFHQQLPELTFHLTVKNIKNATTGI